MQQQLSHLHSLILHPPPTPCQSSHPPSHFSCSLPIPIQSYPSPYSISIPPFSPIFIISQHSYITSLPLSILLLIVNSNFSFLSVFLSFLSFSYTLLFSHSHLSFFLYPHLDLNCLTVTGLCCLIPCSVSHTTMKVPSVFSPLLRTPPPAHPSLPSSYQFPAALIPPPMHILTM
jgi:hypothetical protein